MEADLPHEAVAMSVADGMDLSSVCLHDERKVYNDILPSEIYPEEDKT